MSFSPVVTGAFPAENSNTRYAILLSYDNLFTFIVFLLYMFSYSIATL